MKRDSILIIGQTPDLHIEKVLKILKEKGENVAFLQRYNNHDQLSIHFNNSKDTKVSLKTDKAIAPKNIKSIWMRLKPSLLSEFPGGVGSTEERFMVYEWNSLMKPFLQELSPNKWVNHPDRNHHIGYKVNQLKLAEECGLTIPETIIGNSMSSVLSLFDKYEKLIYKTLSSFIMPPNRVIYSTLISKDDIKNSKDTFAMAPGIYQAYIEKSYELRITIVGERLFIAHIDSQSSKETTVDWRKNQLRPMYKPGKITPDLLKKLKKFHRLAGLTYAAYDFIVDKNENEIFLECNPGGQWLWIEEALDFKISEAIAEELMKEGCSKM
ncbi:MAG: hypothetical protein K2X28_06825 [Alphaproteobacteria bacterium]|nr:hypothetical protein [Alphaproteobacteria bacterium]